MTTSQTATRGARTRATSAVLAEAAALPQAAAAELDVPRLLADYYRHAPDEDVTSRAPVDVLGAALSHARLAGECPPDGAAVRVSNPTADTDGWSSAGTVVEVVTADMPFLVQSVTAELTRQGLGIALVLHPVVLVRRDGAGRLLAVGDPDGRPESWLHVEVSRLPDSALAEVAERLRAVLADVRAAVTDWEDMAASAVTLAELLRREPPPGVPAEEVQQAEELLRWLADDHATLLGSCEYAVTPAADPGGPATAVAVGGSERGLLRRHGTGPDGPAGGVGRALTRGGPTRLLVVSKAAWRSTVQRPAYLDSIAVRRFDGEGRVVGEHRFVGLLAASAYTDSVLRVPVARHKAQEVLRRSGFPRLSHSGRDLLQILETYPRDELFSASVEDLEAVALAVLQLQERRRLRLFLRRDEDAGYLSALVYLPRDRYSREVRWRLEQVLRERLGAATVDYTARVTESVLARVHFTVRAQPGQELADVDVEALEAELARVSRSWDDDLAEALRELVGAEEAARLARAWPDPFPEAYKEDNPAAVGAADLLRVDALDGDDGLDMQLTRAADGGDADLRLRLYSPRPVALSAVLPVLAAMAVRVVDSFPYRLHGTSTHVYDFGLQATGPLHDDVARLALLFSEAFRAVWRGEAESDGLNALVLRAGLSGRQVVVLRAYAAYLRQGGWSFTPAYVEDSLVQHPGIARLLVRLFEVQSDPELEGDREALCEQVAGEVEAALAEVPSLDQDRILRAFLGAVRATTRTNHHQVTADGRPKDYLSLKLWPATVPGLPEPRPEREVWVYSPRMEGVHLRFGAVARGGLRWSDRSQDFRSEVLGLVKAQAVKNAVIVPVGAKGGFVGKRLPDPAADRDAWLAEGVACYRTLIRGLLDVTDDLRDGEVVPPPRVVRRDGDDTYLVVAADKGTASFSDLANEVAAEYGFWLGDAFASGGSVGYDHKAMGITARGAWKSVERHFRELGLDPGTDEITVVGIGDMSGDVFGNGMLLSRSLRLVAAFDHRHVFLDPDPDPAVSYAERQRLFRLPRSSWADYDRALLSPGGGVHPRTAKSIPVTPQVRDRLGLPADCVRLTPDALMSAVLRAPVDLLWNGGIGTWVKATSETSADVGDKGSDAVRVNGAELRCRVVGEGGNLGLTQRGRIEAAAAGVRLNTDAIDNSAGVDCSDHEVNLKILLDQVAASGGLSRADRNALLVDMTDDVAQLVLADNRSQNVLLGNARFHARQMLPVHRRFLRYLEDAGGLHRGLEALPSDAALEARAGAGAGLSSPELAVVAAYAKNTIKAQLLESDLPDDPWYERTLAEYFPVQVRDRFPEQVLRHPLRRQIVATGVVNEMVDNAGISFVFRASEETEATTDEVARAASVASAVFGLRAHWREIERLRPPVTVDVQAELHLEARRLLDRVVRRLLRPGGGGIDVGQAVRRWRPTVAALLPVVPELVLGAESRLLHDVADRWRGQGVPEALALRSASLLHAFPLLDVADLAEAAGEPADAVARLQYAVSASFDVDAWLERITALPRVDRWQALARSSLREELYAALAGVTADVLRTTAPGPVEDRIAAWEQEHAAAVSRARSRLLEIGRGDVFDLAAMTVVVRTVHGVLRP